MSNPLLETPPSGDDPGAVRKNGELADRVADFIELTPLTFCDWSGPSGRKGVSKGEYVVTICPCLVNFVATFECRPDPAPERLRAESRDQMRQTNGCALVSAGTPLRDKDREYFAAFTASRPPP